MKEVVLIACFVSIFFCMNITAQTIHYQYDDLNRLTAVNYGDSLIIQYGYDELGNRISYILDNTITSIDEETYLAEIKAFPNPASEILSIEVEFTKVVEVLFLSLYNSAGQLVYNEKEEVRGGKFSTQIDLSRLATGAYLLEITAGQRKWSRGLTIQR
jgi:YD repeat-containing protein